MYVQLFYLTKYQKGQNIFGLNKFLSNFEVYTWEVYILKLFQTISWLPPL